MQFKKETPTSDYLRRVIRAQKHDRVTIDELKVSLHERGFGILLMFFALPVSIPIPYIPGFTTIFALPLIFLSFQMMVGFEYPWLPKWLLRRSIKRDLLRLIIIKSSPFLRKIEKLLKPRLVILSQGTHIIGFFAFVFALSIAMPLPFTNLLPAIATVILSLGLLSRDGLTILFGIVVGLCGLFFTAGVIVMGNKLLIYLKGLLF